MDNHQLPSGDAKGKKLTLGEILKKKGKPATDVPQVAGSAGPSSRLSSSSVKSSPSSVAGKKAQKMDFENFRKQKLQQRKIVRAEDSKIDHERYHLEKGVSGNGERYKDRLSDGPQEIEDLDPADAYKYKDHRLADGVQQKFPHTTSGQGKTYQDHRLGDGLGQTGTAQGHGEKYQDHRLGNALKHDLLDMSAGQGKKYHDHRLGEGIKVQEEPAAEESQE